MAFLQLASFGGIWHTETFDPVYLSWLFFSPDTCDAGTDSFALWLQ